MFNSLFKKTNARGGKTEIKPHDISYSHRYTDKPKTVDECYLEAINTVASWMSHIGMASRTYNKALLTAEGAYRRNNLDIEYDLNGVFDATTGILKVEGYIRYYDSPTTGNVKKIYICEKDPSRMYFELNALYKETAYNTSK